jgi:hypothetical protein
VGVREDINQLSQLIGGCGEVLQPRWPEVRPSACIRHDGPSDRARAQENPMDCEREHHATSPEPTRADPPVVDGFPSPETLEAAERGEVELGGCSPPLQLLDAFDDAGGVLDSLQGPDDPWLPDAHDDFDDLPTDATALTGRATVEAGQLEARADELAGVAALADSLIRAFEACPFDEVIVQRAQCLAAVVRGAAERAAEARGVAQRTLGHLWDLIEGADDIDDDRLYEDILTARLHIPIAESLVDDAVDDAVPAVRSLARLALAVTWSLPRDPQHEDLHRVARGGLRLDLPGLVSALLDDEEPELRSPTVDELPLELAGLLAHALVEHRTFFIIENTEYANRYVQTLTYDRGVLVESVSDQFLGDQPLMPTDRARLEGLGWLPPAPDGAPNWYRKLREPVDVIAAGQLLVRTLIDVHGLTDPAYLTLVTAATIDPFES